MTYWLRLIASAIIGCCFVNLAARHVLAGRKAQEIKLEACKAGSPPEEARCGKYEVFEDRDAKTGRKISLNILILPAPVSRASLSRAR